MKHGVKNENKNTLFINKSIHTQRYDARLLSMYVLGNFVEMCISGPIQFR